MTSGNFSSYPVAEITIDRDARQRKTLVGIEELRESIARIGLINPIVIDNEGMLIAGERRLTACKELGWDNISVQFAEDLDEYSLQSIEFEENAKRKDLTWQEEVEALSRLHKLKQDNEPEWTATDTADMVGFSPRYVEKKLQVAASMADEQINSAETFSTALNMVKRDAERKKTSSLEAVKKTLSSTIPQNFDTISDEAYDSYLDKQEEERGSGKKFILNASFHDWQASYTGSKFNLLHCDFPYGINVADAPRMSSGIKDHYKDSPDVYWALLNTLEHAMENVVADSAHMIFWFSPKFYTETKPLLERMGWKVADYPLIWYKSDGAGVAPDPQRGPRNVYEMAFFCSRGDRKLTTEGTKANCFAHPGKREGAIHVSEKPYAMLSHFMAMLCDDYSSVLDPTCGSGNALKVAQDQGASRFLGLELSEEFHKITCDNWEKR